MAGQFDRPYNRSVVTTPSTSVGRDSLCQYRCPSCTATSTRSTPPAGNIRCDNCGRFYYAPDYQLAPVLAERERTK